MSPQRRNPEIASLAEGDSVAGFALLAKKERRQDKNGRDFLDLVLADESGSIAAKVWSDASALDGDYEAGTFVAYKGLVKSYRGELQMTVTDCRTATEADREFGFDPGRLVPTTREDIDELWRRLSDLVASQIQRAPLKRLALETLETYGGQLREHPAAKMIHHAYRGGLLEHVVSMAELAVAVADHYREIDRDLLLVGVLFHDLGKLIELESLPANDYTLEGRLVGHVVIGRDLLRERCAAIEDFPADLRLHLEHLVLSHQGRQEFGSPVVPMTAEALALNAIDDLDSKLAQLRQAALGASELPYLKPLGRYVYLPRSNGEAEVADPGEESEEATLALEPPERG